MSENYPGGMVPVLPTTCPSNAADFFAVLGNPWRWKMVQILAGGEALSATDVASKLGRDFDGVSKHLRLMRETGVISSKRGEDQRYEFFHLPKQYLAEPGVVNFGWLRVSVV
jgi:predicted transcriptional regulator